MPWSKKNYPDAMKNLSEAVRNKAIKIANAILKSGRLDEGAVIAIAISKAKDTMGSHAKKK